MTSLSTGLAFISYFGIVLFGYDTLIVSLALHPIEQD